MLRLKNTLLFLFVFVLNLFFQTSSIVPAIRVIFHQDTQGEPVPDLVYGKQQDDPSQVGFFVQDPSQRPAVPAPIVATDVIDFSIPSEEDAEKYPKHTVKYNVSRQQFEGRVVQQLNILGQQLEGLIPGFNNRFQLNAGRGIGNVLMGFVNQGLERFLGDAFNVDRIELDVREVVALKYPGFEDLAVSIMRSEPLVLMRSKLNKVIESFYANEEQVQKLKESLDTKTDAELGSALGMYSGLKTYGVPFIPFVQSSVAAVDPIAAVATTILQERTDVFLVEVNRKMLDVANQILDELKQEVTFFQRFLNPNYRNLIPVLQKAVADQGIVIDTLSDALDAHLAVPKKEKPKTQEEQIQLQKAYKPLINLYHNVVVAQEQVIAVQKEVVKVVGDQSRDEILRAEEAVKGARAAYATPDVIIRLEAVATRVAAPLRGCEKVLNEQNKILEQCNKIDSLFKEYVNAEVIKVDGIKIEQPVQLELSEGVAQRLEDVKETNRKRLEVEKAEEAKKLAEEAQAAQKLKFFIKPLKIGLGATFTGFTAKFLYDYKVTKQKELQHKLLLIQTNSILNEAQKKQAIIDAQAFSKAYALSPREKLKAVLLATGWAALGIVHYKTRG